MLELKTASYFFRKLCEAKIGYYMVNHLFLPDNIRAYFMYVEENLILSYILMISSSFVRVYSLQHPLIILTAVF